jgi:hypothetical protein
MVFDVLGSLSVPKEDGCPESPGHKRHGNEHKQLIHLANDQMLINNGKWALKMRSIQARAPDRSLNAHRQLPLIFD